ncbi:MAG: DNA helicase UvrD, partial [Gammaproteobacteria bacterium]|nr:DNA helicase UvrD [Gammaproteobacteria bacterium]
ATRAMRELYLTYAEQRRLHGVDSLGQPSRFIAEMPAELIEEVRPRIRVSRPIFQRQASSAAGRLIDPEAPVRLGQRVRHGKFGEGVVLNCEGAGAHARVQVNFETCGAKWLVMSYAKLELM